MKISTDGAVQYFTFHSFSGENAVDLNEARTYIKDCAELLSPEFLAKIADDYKSKIEDFNWLEKQENEIRAAIQEKEKRNAVNEIENAMELSTKDGYSDLTQSDFTIGEHVMYQCKEIVLRELYRDSGFTADYTDNSNRGFIVNADALVKFEGGAS